MTTHSLLRAAVLIIPVMWITACGRKIDRGAEAPDFSLKDVKGVQIKLSQQRGKLVLLHFWADYCSECRAEFPRMQKAYLNLRRNNFELLAVNAGQSRLHVEDFKDEYNITFPMLVDEAAAVPKQYQVRALPTNVVISPDGRILDVLVGWASEEYMQRIVAEAGMKKEGQEQP